MSDLTVREQTFVFGRHRSLLGIRTTAPGVPTRRSVLLLGAGIIHRVGPSRALVELSRSLALAGHECLRFDLSGVGDSARATEPILRDAVIADIRDAVDVLLEGRQPPGDAGGVVLVGFCSGADNAFHVAADDERVHAVVLFDPTVTRTSGFRRREVVRRLRSATAWRNFLSGRAIRLRLQPAFGVPDAGTPPPEYYGLLLAQGAEADERARRMSARGVRRLFVISAGALGYCNSPAQLREALPTGWRDDLDTVEWAMHLDHVLSTRRQVEWLCARTRSWLETLDGTSHGSE